MLQNVTDSYGKNLDNHIYTISEETLHKPDTVKNLGFDTQFIFFDHKIIKSIKHIKYWV